MRASTRSGTSGCPVSSPTRRRERRQVGGRQQSQPIVHLPRLGETQARLLELGERLQLGAAILERFEICKAHAGQELEEAASVCRTIVGAAMGPPATSAASRTNLGRAAPSAHREP